MDKIEYGKRDKAAPNESPKADNCKRGIQVKKGQDKNMWALTTEINTECYMLKDGWDTRTERLKSEKMMVDVVMGRQKK